MTTGRKMFFDLSIFDIQWENKGYSICQIVQNNDLPKGNILPWPSSYQCLAKKVLEYVHIRGDMNSYRFEIHMTFYFGCISKRPNILMDIRRYFISGSVYQNDRNEFQTYMYIKHNIQRVCTYSFHFGWILFKFCAHVRVCFRG